MDKEYVGREEVIKILEHYDLSSGSTLGYHSGAIECAISEIEMLSAADVVEVRHGRWLCVDTDTEQFFLCNRCKKKEYWESNYCPDCGAKMDEE